tara:strand:+ start:295 stop:735 length:441 start_codon:yes stop_codon:yes gene_type:complete
MPSIRLSLNQDYLTVITRGSANQGTIYKRTVPSQYYSADITIKEILKVISDNYPDIRISYKDCVKGLTYKINIRRSAPPEDVYKGLPASNRYIPDRLITLVAEYNSVYFDNVKKSKVRYLMGEYDSKRIDAETFEREFNQVLEQYR